MTPMPKSTMRSSCHQPGLVITDKIKETLSSLKQDLIETPVSKHKHKILSRELKESEKRGFSQTARLVFERIVSVPRKIHWKILIDLADFAKRESKFEEAKVLFKLITNL
jgi:hypothetical protein